MKRFVALLFCLIFALSLVACGNDSITDKIKLPNDDDNNDDTPNINFTLQETVIVDNDDCLIKVTGAEYDDIWGFRVKVYLENRSDDTTYRFSADNATINDVNTLSIFTADVAPGKKANEEITFLDSEFYDNDIGEYTDIQLTFTVRDSEDYSAEDIVNETVHIYPYGEDKAATYIRESEPSDRIIMDNEYATVIVTGYDYDEYTGYRVKLFLVNKTDITLVFDTIDDASVNDYMFSPFFMCNLAAGKCAFDSIDVSPSTMDDNGITDVEEIEFSLRVCEVEDFLSYKWLAKETVTLNP